MLRNLLLFAALTLHAETGADAWLRHAPLDEASARQYRASLPAAAVTFTFSPVAQSAQSELLRGVRGMLGRTLRVQSTLPPEPAIVLGTLADLHQFHITADLPPDAFWLTTASLNGVSYTVITAVNDRGVLYGTFALLRKIALGEPVAKLNEKQSPYAPVRWVNEWDNLDGTIERGYGGRSIFWDNLQARADLTPRRRLRPPPRLARHQCLLHQQRQRQPPRARPRFHPPDRAHRRRLPPLGRPRRHRRRFRQSQIHRRTRHLRPSRPQRGRLVEGPASMHSTPPSPISPASSSRPIPKAASAPPPTTAPTPTPPT